MESSRLELQLRSRPWLNAELALPENGQAKRLLMEAHLGMQHHLRTVVHPVEDQMTAEHGHEILD